jgi:flagellar biosynthesis/type III secretory pathway protein FliH
MHFAEFSRADEIDAARRRTFDTLELDTRERSMPDPQQQAYADEANLVMPGAGSMRVMVEPMEFPSMDRATRREQQFAGGLTGAPTRLDPAEEARLLIAEARSTARQMLAQARDAIAAERAQAVQQGYDEGYAAGAAEADAETAGLVETCEKIGIHVMEERERVLSENEADLVELSISIARRIVNAAIDVDETLVVEACRGAMRKAFQRGSMQVLANPADLALLRAAGPALAAELGGVDHLDFVEERRLDRGSVIVRTPAGEIDATIQGKADKIEQALREGIEQRRAERRSSAA